MTFDESKFNWKEAIFHLTKDMSVVKTTLTNHLESHRFWKDIKTKILTGMVVVFGGWSIVEILADLLKK